MSTYEVRFIKEDNDPSEKHLVVEVEALNHDAALQKAIEKKKGETWLAKYGFRSVEIKHF